MNAITKINGLSFVLINISNGHPLYMTQMPYDSHFYYVKCISSRRYEVSRTDHLCNNDEWLDEVSTFEDAVQAILRYAVEPW